MQAYSIAQQGNNEKLGYTKVDRNIYTNDATDPYNGLFVLPELNEAIRK
jgi:hypothetical protein